MKLFSSLAFIICSTILVQYVESLAVMSVDLGSEWVKVGIVSPGVPMEIALNKESKRKSATIVSFRDNVRNFGEDAQTVGVRFPKNAYIYFLDLVGKEINHPIVKLFQTRFSHYELIEDPLRKTVLFKHDSNTFYSPEELIAQVLVKSKDFAEQAAHQPIKECVLTVPGFFNQIERKALLQAAKLANLKVLQLINDYTAVALNYGIFRSKEFNETTQYIMFYDMGASSTTATIVSYQNVKIKERGFVETHPEVAILGVGYDRTLGGLEIQVRLRDHLATEFNKLKKTKNDVFKNPRAMAKLFKEAGRLKTILSANAEHYAQIEGLLDEQDFKLLVTRNELEDLFKDLLDRIGKPVEQALKSAQISKDILNQVVLYGAGTRVPKIQEILHNIVGQDLAKNLNTDEAATMGAVYKAADLSTGFQVKKFITKDAVIFPIQVIFERDADGKNKRVKRTLFGLMNPYPQKKIITFNKHTSDFYFNVNYGDLEYLPAEEITNIGSQNLTKISLSNVFQAFKNHEGENSESKGIKAHFQMDESGVLNLLNVELVVEKIVTEKDEEGTLSKLGSTISKLFGNEEKATEEKPVKEDTKEDKEPEKADEQGDIKEKPTINETVTQNKTEDLKATKETKPKIITVKEPITATEEIVAIQPLSEDQFKDSKKKLKKLDDIDHELNRRASSLNNLETFVIDVQNKLNEDEFSEAATEEEKEKIAKICSTTSDWLYEDGMDADATTYEEKLEELKSETNNWFAKVWEHHERPEALGALNSMLNHSRNFLNNAKNLTAEVNPDKDIFTNKELEVLLKVIEESEEWRNKSIAAQDKLKKHEAVVLTVKSITDKMGALDREVKYLVNKLRMWKPKKVEKKKEKPENVSEAKSSEKPVEEVVPDLDDDVEVENSDDGANENEESNINKAERTKSESVKSTPVTEEENLHSEL